MDVLKEVKVTIEPSNKLVMDTNKLARQLLKTNKKLRRYRLQFLVLSAAFITSWIRTNHRLIKLETRDQHEDEFTET